MAKRKNSSRHGHSGDPRKRAAEEQARAQAEATPELEDEVGAALEAGHPIDIVMLASSLIAGLDPDARTPDDEATDRLPQPEEFVRMFLDSSDPRLHVLAWTVARLLPDSRLHHAVDAALDPGTVPALVAAAGRRRGGGAPGRPPTRCGTRPTSSSRCAWGRPTSR